MSTKLQTEVRADEFSWNVICHGFALEESLLDTIGQDLPLLANVLSGVDPADVHLHFSISRSASAGDYFIAGSLRLPGTVLHADESADRAVDGVRHATARLREDAASYLTRLRENAPAHFDPKFESLSFAAPMPAATGPQQEGELVRDLFTHFYPRLLRFARRRLRFSEEAGIIPPGRLDPRDLVDEAARVCLENPRGRPKGISHLLWFHQLIRLELQNRCDDWESTSRMRVDLPGAHESQLGAGDQTLDEVPFDLSDEEPLPLDTLPDPSASSPDHAAEGSDLIAQVMRKSIEWAELEREIFVMHFLEGFESDEIAAFERIEVNEVEQLLAAATARIRDLFRDEARL